MQTDREKTIERLWQNSDPGTRWAEIATAYDAGVTAERERLADAVSQAQRERNNTAQVRDAALSALFEVERLAGHDDAMTEWRDKWAHLWALREGHNVRANRETTR